MCGFFGVIASKEEKMLSEKIDLSSFMIWLFENYKTIDFSKPFLFNQFIK